MGDRVFVKAKRTNISAEVETRILTESARRCCLCLKFNDDGSFKRGQITHINHERSDSRFDNLAYLCLAHHDEYDGSTSQSKGITPNELRHAKAYLHSHIQAVDRARERGCPVNRVKWVAAGESVIYTSQSDGTWHEKHAARDVHAVLQEESRDDCMIVLYNRQEALWIRLHEGIKYWTQKLHHRNLWKSAERGHWLE